MKIQKTELTKTEVNHSFYIYFKDFMNLYKACTAKPLFFLVNDTTLASDNPLLSRCNLLEII